MTREEAIKCIQEEKLRYERAPWVNGCPMTEEWQKAIDICDMAISALRARQEQESKPLNGWISVEERLPDKDDNYIVTACDEGCSAGEGIWYSTVVVVAEYYKGSWTWYDGGHEYSLEGIVTHWQPMPEPPETEKTEE